MDYSEYAQTLLQDGVVVLPALSPEDLQLYHTAFWQAARSFPEYLNPADPDTVYVLGAFGALGNPASFHNEMVRHFRKYMMIQAISLFSEVDTMSPIPGRNLQQLVDRMSIRRVGTSLGRETWHRDQAPAPVEDDIFGGWVNLDLSSNQRFSCMPGTHLVRTEEAGFARETPVDESQKQVYEVPPGHWILFYQNILHEVLPGRIRPTEGSPYSPDSIRIYLGFRLTPSDESLYDYESAITEQGVMLNPSGQLPPMWSPNHLTFHSQNLINWSVTTFKPQCLEQKDSPKLGTYTVVHKIMRSLTDYGLPLYPPYTEEERELLQPNRAWTIDDQIHQF